VYFSYFLISPKYFSIMIFILMSWKCVLMICYYKGKYFLSFMRWFRKCETSIFFFSRSPRTLFIFLNKQDLETYLISNFVLHYLFLLNRIHKRVCLEQMYQKIFSISSKSNLKDLVSLCINLELRHGIHEDSNKNSFVSNSSK